MSEFDDAIHDLLSHPGILSRNGHQFRISATGEHGIHTGRPRRRVECLTCHELIHEATNGVMWNVEFHLREVAQRSGKEGE